MNNEKSESEQSNAPTIQVSDFQTSMPTPIPNIDTKTLSEPPKGRPSIDRLVSEIKERTTEKRFKSIEEESNLTGILGNESNVQRQETLQVPEPSQSLLEGEELTFLEQQTLQYKFSEFVKMTEIKEVFQALAIPIMTEIKSTKAREHLLREQVFKAREEVRNMKGDVKGLLNL